MNEVFIDPGEMSWVLTLGRPVKTQGGDGGQKLKHVYEVQAFAKKDSKPYGTESRIGAKDLAVNDVYWTMFLNTEIKEDWIIKDEEDQEYEVISVSTIGKNQFTQLRTEKRY